jgi:putative chitinase
MKRRTFLMSAPLVILGSRAARSQTASNCDAQAEAGDAIVTEQKIAKFSPRARLELAKAISSGWGTASSFGLVTPIRIHHFMAQIATETGGFVSIDENLSYSVERLKQVWPKRFTDHAVAVACARNPQALAEHVYGGRLGNDKPGDGYRYRGSGFIQLTGKANFRARTQGLGLQPDAVAAPDQIRQPKSGFDAALKYWNAVKANEIADRDDLLTLRTRVNGGLHGLADLKIWLARARRFYKAGAPSPNESDDAADVEELAAVQDRLKELGVLTMGPQEADSPSKTIDALQQVREERGLTQKNVSGVSPRLGIATLYDEDMLYALTDPDDRKSEERGNLE